MSPPPRSFWRTLLLAALVAICFGRPALAVSVATVSRPDGDSLIVQFTKPGLYPDVTRTGAKELTLRFPPGALAGEPAPDKTDFGSSRLVSGLTAAGDKLVLALKTDAIGYVAWPDGEHALKLQIYHDPAGANWVRSGQAAATRPPGPPPDAGPAVTLPVTPPNNKPGPLELPPLPPALAEPDKAPSAAGPAAAPASAAARPPAPAREPFFAQPYALRAQALHVPPDKAPTLRPAGLAEHSLPGPGAPSAAGEAASGTAGEAASGTAGEAASGTAGEAASGTAPDGTAMYRVKLPPIPPAVTAADGVRGAITPPGQTPPAALATGAAVKAPTAEATVKAPAAEATAKAPAAGGAVATQAAPPPPSSTPTPPPAPAGEAASAEAGKPAKPAEPPVPEDANLLVAAQAEKLAGNLEGAKNLMESLKLKKDLSPEVREELLHSLAAVYTDLYKDDPAAHYDQIRGAYEEAINANPDSYRVPEAMLQLGMLNLRVGNLPEAKGYFNVLTKKYPTDANVPLVNFYWGEYYYDHGDYKKATEQYQQLIEKYPESKFVREGAMGLAKTLVRLGRYKEAAQIADYIDKRWPRYYVDFPGILRIDGDIAYRNGDIKKAKDDYLMFYNLEPKVKDLDMVLSRLGDIYAQLGNKPAAVDFYNLAIKEAPDSEGGLIAKMRLAEQGIHDQPSVSEMFSLFDKPAAGSPEEIYTSIIREHPESPLAPLAQIKLAMWLLYRQNYPDAIKQASRFLEMYPKSDLAPRATDVAVTAFEKMAADRLARKDYARLVQSWRDNPVLAANRDRLSEATRLGLAMAFFRTGANQDALTAAMPFIGPKETPDGNMALIMAMRIHEGEKDWRGVVDLARKVQNWKFGPTERRDLEFTVAQALENLGDFERSRQLWRKLAGDQLLESGKRCFAMYYMAKEAMAKKELEKAELYAGEAAVMFRETGKDPDKLKSSLNILVETAKGLGQYPKALQWAGDYAKLCKEGDDDWSSNRLRIAAIQRAMGDMDGWRKTLTAMRDAAPNSLYGRMAASDLATNGLQNRLDALTQSR